MRQIISLKRNQKSFRLSDFIIQPFEVDCPWLKAVYFLLGMMVKFMESPARQYYRQLLSAQHVKTANKKMRFEGTFQAGRSML